MGVTARLLKQELLIHLDYGLPFGDVVVRYRGPLGEPDGLAERVIHLLRARIPRDVQYELDELYQAFARRIPAPAEVGGIVQPALATILIQDQERPPGLALAWLTYVQQVPAAGPRLEQEHLALGAADLTPPERSTLERLRHRIKGIAWTDYQGPVGQ
ncbi:MAG TPA: hypothetical protein VFO08_00965 [Methylomirabilota bacterium]|nr:hypothetical protein [Methylomirabilota bacterium]